MSTHLVDGLAKLLNIGDTFTHKGREYKVKEANLRQRAEFATWVEQRAWDALERRGLNGGNEIAIDRDRRGLVGDIAAGLYEWGGEFVLKATNTAAGAARLLYTVLRADYPEITEATCREMVDEQHRKVAQWLAENTDPKDLLGLVGLPTGEAAFSGSPTANPRSHSTESAT